MSTASKEPSDGTSLRAFDFHQPASYGGCGDPETITDCHGQTHLRLTGSDTVCDLQVANLRMEQSRGRRDLDRTAWLASVDVPALVIHGADDLMCDVSGGRATAAAIPGAELVVVDGMGHDLPRALWPEITSRIPDLVQRVEAAGAGV